MCVPHVVLSSSPAASGFWDVTLAASCLRFAPAPFSAILPSAPLPLSSSVKNDVTQAMGGETSGMSLSGRPEVWLIPAVTVEGAPSRPAGYSQ